MIKNKQFILVFDLDDTLYKEIDFLKSAYQDIAAYIGTQCQLNVSEIYEFLIKSYNNGLNAFEMVINTYNLTPITVKDLLSIYRNHTPNIKLSSTNKLVLYHLKNQEQVFKVGLITDGRGVQQRQKIKALGLTDYFDAIIISEEFGSEKPNPSNFLYYETTYGDAYHYIYVGDNTQKDFIAPNALGWTTICLKDNGQNIHPQLFEIPDKQKPHYTISEFTDLESLLLSIQIIS